MKKGADPFSKFVNSIIADKSKPKQAIKVEEKLTKVDTNDAGGDLALIMSSTTPQPFSSSVQKKSDRALNSGLGYAPSKSELETATQVQRLKNQIRRAQQDQDLQDKVEAKERKEGMDSKVSMIARKKEETDVRGKMIEEKRERRREKKQRQKERAREKEKQVAQEAPRETPKETMPRENQPIEASEKHKYVRPSGYVTSVPIVGRTYKKKEVQGDGDRKKFKTKTRSRQKNKRRDNRSEEVKKAKGFIV